MRSIKRPVGVKILSISKKFSRDGWTPSLQPVLPTLTAICKFLPMTGTELGSLDPVCSK